MPSDPNLLIFFQKLLAKLSTKPSAPAPGPKKPNLTQHDLAPKDRK